MKIERRKFLGSTMAGTAAAFASGNVVRAAPVDLNPTAIVPLGKILKVSRIGFGTGMRGWLQESNQTKLGREKFEALLRFAYDQGIRLFDSADLYGSHPNFTSALAEHPRESYTLVSKIWWRKGGLKHEERPDADVCVERFLKEFKTDYIDLVQLHCVTNPKWPEELRKQMDILSKLKEKGVIRAHGVSCHAIGALEAAAKEPWVDVIHTRINPYGAKMDGPAEKVVPALKRVHAAGKGVIGMKLIGEGQFRDDEQKREHSVSFVMGLGCVDAMIVGFEKEAEITDFKARVARALGVV
jgi:aryl-alcohol dehydrogenase-like predicted oxidoreductase